MLAILALALHGCASPGLSMMQTVRVETPGCAQASCDLRNDLGRWQLASTPGAVTLTTSTTALQVSCRSAAGGFGTIGVTASTTPLTGAGAVAGGVVGGATAGAVFGGAALAFIPVLGVIIVASSVGAGAAAGRAAESRGRMLTYPALISMPMSCPATDGTPAPSVVPGLSLGLGISSLPDAQARAIGLDGRDAVRVTLVAPGGRADLAGLRAGDLILGTGGQLLPDPATFEERMLRFRPCCS